MQLPTIGRKHRLSLVALFSVFFLLLGICVPVKAHAETNLTIAVTLLPQATGNDLTVQESGLISTSDLAGNQLTTRKGNSPILIRKISQPARSTDPKTTDSFDLDPGFSQRIIRSSPRDGTLTTSLEDGFYLISTIDPVLQHVAAYETYSNGTPGRAASTSGTIIQVDNGNAYYWFNGRKVASSGTYVRLFTTYKTFSVSVLVSTEEQGNFGTDASGQPIYNKIVLPGGLIYQVYGSPTSFLVNPSQAFIESKYPSPSMGFGLMGVQWNRPLGEVRSSLPKPTN